MTRLVSKLLAAAAAALLLAGPAAAATQFTDVEGSHVGPIMDLLVMRPLGLVGLGAGAVLWVPAAAMTVAVQPTEVKVPTEHLIMKPFRYVFSDPIGSH